VTTSAAPDRLIGELLASRYRIEAWLGRGAMGTVYRARHVDVGRLFAVKVLHSCFLGDEWAGERFSREAKVAGALHHPNVTSVVDVGETSDGRRYLVMEHAEGPTLLDLIEASAPLPGPRVVSIVRQLCDGLQHAHDLGLIHRDFKPENVIIECDRHGTETPRIVDFGIAILCDEASSYGAGRLTTSGMLLGTPQYMAPEHATGAPIDHRIDLFALGVTCFEMLTGWPPFDGDGVDLARANAQRETPVMSVRVPGLQVDPLLEAFTRKLMMKARDARPGSARAARHLIELIDRDRPTAAAALGVAHVAVPASSLGAAPPPPASGVRPPDPRTRRLAVGSPPTRFGSPIPAVARPSPVVQPQRPAVGSQHATVGSQSPTVGSQSPTAGSQSPTAGPQSPAAGSQSPAAGSQSPAAGSQSATAGPQSATAGPQSATAGPPGPPELRTDRLVGRFVRRLR
jgi:serine/threonine-protein kinase